MQCVMCLWSRGMFMIVFEENQLFTERKCGFASAQSRASVGNEIKIIEVQA